MDIELVAAGGALVFLSGSFVGLFFRRRRIQVIRSRYAVDAAHEHHGAWIDLHGWHCDCGEHIHRYNLTRPDTDGQFCVCGKGQPS